MDSVMKFIKEKCELQEQNRRLRRKLRIAREAMRTYPNDRILERALEKMKRVE